MPELSKFRIQNLVIANRTHHKAQELADPTSARAIYWENVWNEITLADVVISSVSGDCFFIDKPEIENYLVQHAKYFIDLSMPCSISADQEAWEGVRVYNMDAIKNRATEAMAKRLHAIPEVEEIISEVICGFSS